MFIMQLDAIEGSTNYIRQIGSAGDDYVTDVTCDKEGNAIPLDKQRRKCHSAANHIGKHVTQQ
jgi:hypothetical protein